MSVALVPIPVHVFKVTSVAYVVDGDTMDVVVDKKHSIKQDLRVRLLEVDTPERKEGQPYTDAKEFSRKWLDRAMASNTLAFEGERMDSFGRALGYFWDSTTAEGLAFRLIQEGLGEEVGLYEHLKQLGVVE